MKSPAKEKPRQDRLPGIRRQLRRYFVLHPGSPAAVRRPHIVIDHGRYVALLGKSVGRGIFGFGTSVFSALRSFDELYSRSKANT